MPIGLENLKGLSIEYSFIASIPLDEVKSLSDEEIAEVLMAKYLEHYLSGEIEPNKRIVDFIVGEIKPAHYEKPNPVFYISYRVKPVQESTSWIAGSGMREGEWIRQGNQHRLLIVDGYYVLGHAFNG